jgi:hypothetical protein
MATAFEIFVNNELPTRISIPVPVGGNLTAEKVLRATGVGLAVKQVDNLRAGTTPDTSVLVIDSSQFDQLSITGQTTTMAISNPTGVLYDGQRLSIRIKSAASQTLLYDTQFRSSPDLPLSLSTTGGGKTDYMGFVWNDADTKWDYVASTFGF